MSKDEFKKLDILKFFDKLKDEESALHLLAGYGVVDHLRKCPRCLNIMEIKDKNQEISKKLTIIVIFVIN